MHDYKIYYLSCPKTYEVRYVGVTVGTLSRRLSQHYYETKIRKGSHKLNWISSLQREKLKPNCCIAEHCTDENWEEREKYHISLFSNLTNASEGGLGVVVDRSTTSIQRSSNAKKIPIVQLTKDGNFIKEWTSAADAKKELGFKTVTSINNVLKKGTNLGHGFRWMYLKDYQDKGISERLSLKDHAFENSKKTKKGVEVYDLNGQLLFTFSSRTECAKHLNCYSGNISDAITENRPFRKQFMIKDISGSTTSKRFKYEVVGEDLTYDTMNELSQFINLSVIALSRRFRKSDTTFFNGFTIKRY